MNQPTTDNNDAQLTETRMVWIRALESGEWKQGYGSLHTAENTHCCIGVAQDVHPDLNRLSDYDDIAKAYGYFDDDAFAIQGVTIESTLVQKNDSQIVPFPEIAAYLRELWGLQNAV